MNIFFTKQRDKWNYWILFFSICNSNNFKMQIGILEVDYFKEFYIFFYYKSKLKLFMFH